MTPDELVRALEAPGPPLLLDVRSRAEYRAGHIAGAVNLPFWTLAFRRPPRPAGPIVVYCGHGPRARIARLLLRLRGVVSVRLLEGHMTGWRRAGRPLSLGD